jgi:hypothetical protein
VPHQSHFHLHQLAVARAWIVLVQSEHMPGRVRSISSWYSAGRFCLSMARACFRALPRACVTRSSRTLVTAALCWAWLNACRSRYLMPLSVSPNSAPSLRKLRPVARYLALSSSSVTPCFLHNGASMHNVPAHHNPYKGIVCALCSHGIVRPMCGTLCGPLCRPIHSPPGRREVSGCPACRSGLASPCRRGLGLAWRL